MIALKKKIMGSPLEGAVLCGDLDDRAEGLARKIRDAHRMHVPVVGVIGDRGLESASIAVRERGRAPFAMSIRDFAERFSRRAEERSE